MRELLLLLALVPIAAYNLTDILAPKRKWLWTGIAFGLLTVAPVSMCLLQSTHFPLIGKLLGLCGLFLNLIHGPLGYFTVVALGITSPAWRFQQRNSASSTSSTVLPGACSMGAWAIILTLNGPAQPKAENSSPGK